MVAKQALRGRSSFEHDDMRYASKGCRRLENQVFRSAAETFIYAFDRSLFVPLFSPSPFVIAALSPMLTPRA